MAAVLPPAKQRRIQELRKKGWRLEDIARDVQCGRSTAARYAAMVDREIKIGDAPAGQLSAEQVKMLAVLANDALRLVGCGQTVDLGERPLALLPEREVEALGLLAELALQAQANGERVSVTGGAAVSVALRRRLDAMERLLKRVSVLVERAPCSGCGREVTKAVLAELGCCPGCQAAHWMVAMMAGQR